MAKKKALISISPVTSAQWKKVLKAVVYSFISSGAAVLVATNYELSKQTLIAVLTAGINGALVTIKQVLTDD